MESNQNPALNSGKKLPIIGITQGDSNGISLELIIKTFAEKSIFNYCIPVLYGSPKTFSFHKKVLNAQDPVYAPIRSASEAKAGKLNLVNCNEAGIEIKLGQPSAAGGKEALLCLDAALADAANLDALVTAPLDKSTVAENFPGFTGHTGYIAEKLGNQKPLMFLVSEDIKVALATEHVPVSKISEVLTTELLIQKINALYNSLKNDYLITRPRIAVLGLNPHAGDNGVIGSEEKNVIIPAIKRVFDDGKLVYGPFPADGFFGNKTYKGYDAVLAMYHDQGLIPFKSMSFYDGVNFTAGLSLIRTAPDHGTAYALAGKGEAETLSFQNAIYEAIKIVRNRNQNKEDKNNPLPFGELKREKFRIDF